MSAAALLLLSADAAAQAEPAVTSLPAVAVDAPKEKPRPVVRQNAAATRVARTRARAATTPAQRHAPSPTVSATPSSASAPFAAPARAELGNLPKEYAGGQAARGARLGMLGNRDFLDTPFNVTSYTSKLIENQQARTLSDVLENDPSVRFTVSSGQVRENFRIRGFSVLVSETALNGLYGVAPDGRVPTEFLERVEVLKGPAALLSGMAPYGAVGGSINLVTKQAGDTPVTRVTGDYTSNSQFGTHIDIGRRFGQDNAFGIRFNGVYRGGDTTLDYQSRERGLEALALDYRGVKLRIALDAYFNQEVARGGVPMMASFTGTGVAAAPDSSNNIFRGLSGRMNNSGAMGRAEYDLADNVTLFASAGAIDARFNGLTNSTVATNVNVLGRYNGTAINLRGYTDTISFQGGLRADFRTFDIGHRLSLSAANLESKTGSAFQRGSAFVSSIYFPVTPLVARDPGEAPKSTDTTLSSIALADTLSAFDDRAQLILGLRAQRVQAKSYNATGAETNYYDESAVTPAFGLIVKPLPMPMSVYANYIEGLTQGDRVTDTTANYNQMFPPYKSRQIETGVKWDAGTVANTLSFYEIEKPSLIKSGNVYNSDGRQRNQGIEWNVFGEIVEGVRILGGAAYTIGVLTKTANGQLDGKTAYGTPKWQVNLGGEWDTPFVPGLTLEGRVVYTSAQFVNSANTQKIPEWARLDAGLRYSTQLVDKKVTFRANANNLLDHNYWAGSYFADGIVTLSSPRTVLMSATVDF
ncbi:TonB-dependent siderophore receptor [Methylosinus sp. Sm6]|nr:TonB-dependent siderophore receptor [Methylosinus sp. Sm6]